MDVINYAKIKRIEEEKADKKQEEWIVLSLINGWEHYLTYGPLRVMKDSLGFVHLEGTVHNGTGAGVITSLPVGYRPAYPFIFGYTGEGVSGGTLRSFYIHRSGNLHTYVSTRENLMLHFSIVYKAGA